MPRAAREPIRDVTQGELLRRLAAECGEREAFVHAPGDGPALRWTWAELERESAALARGLLALGLAQGERVVLWSENRPEWVALQWALARLGCPLVTANTALAREEIGYVVRQSRSSAVIASRGARGREYLDALEELAARDALGEELRLAIALDPDERWRELALPGGPGRRRGLGLDDVRSLAGEVSADRLAARERGVRADEPVNIQYTSGTTGFPKGVVLSHANLVENACAIARRLRMGAEDRLLLQVPLFHCFGCVVSVLGAATHRAALVSIGRFDPGAALRAIEAERCTILHGVPTMFQALLEHPDRPQRDLSSLRGGVMAGAACPVPLMRRVIEELGARGVLAAYGLTEASPGITCSSPDDPLEVRCETVGTALEGVEVRIVDPATGTARADGETGELQARGPNVMQGYFDRPEETAEALLADGWLRTGDLATRDASGLVRIVGRIKELVIRGGENVSPAEVEDALREHPAVRDAAVFGVPSERFGEEVAAAVVLRPGATLDAEALVRSLEGRLAAFKRPSLVRFVDAFPLTASGKVQRFRLAELCGLDPAPKDVP